MKKITKIVTFYDDGTFTEFTPSPYMPTTPWPPTTYPVMPTNPMNPNTHPWPSYPPYTITCKMADGTTQEIPGPAYATGANNETNS